MLYPTPPQKNSIPKSVISTKLAQGNPPSPHVFFFQSLITQQYATRNNPPMLMTNGIS